MLEHIILGAIQGVTEWIPVSSKACIMVAKVNLFQSQETLNELINYALFLHLGTFGAAVAYFHKDLLGVLKALLNPAKADQESKKILLFLTITTLLTALGQLLVSGASSLAYSAPHAKAALMLIIAFLLIIAGFLQIKTRSDGKRAPKDLTIVDGIILGLIQAMATLPGLSRAGTTMAGLSFRNFDKEYTLKLSFLMSLPVIFFGNLVKNHETLLSAGPHWMGALTAFLVGVLSINALMNFARRVNFGVFLVMIGMILMGATLFGALD